MLTLNKSLVKSYSKTSTTSSLIVALASRTRIQNQGTFRKELRKQINSDQQHLDEFKDWTLFSHFVNAAALLLDRPICVMYEDVIEGLEEESFNTEGNDNEILLKYGNGVFVCVGDGTSTSAVKRRFEEEMAQKHARKRQRRSNEIEKTLKESTSLHRRLICLLDRGIALDEEDDILARSEKCSDFMSEAFDIMASIKGGRAKLDRKFGETINYDVFTQHR